jgi:hypothetical protein
VTDDVVSATVPPDPVEPESLDEPDPELSVGEEVGAGALVSDVGVDVPVSPPDGVPPDVVSPDVEVLGELTGKLEVESLTVVVASVTVPVPVPRSESAARAFLAVTPASSASARATAATKELVENF